ncbi:MAG: amidase family protein, partial [Phycisphaerales bacterium]
MPSDSGSEANMDEGAKIPGLVGALRRRESSAVELVDQYLQRIDRLNSSLNCFCETYPERARATAQQIDQQLAAGDQIGP